MSKSNVKQPGKRERSRMEIMHVAKGLFEEKGTQNVTFQEIAERAGMCRTTIFNHFPTIDALMAALFEQEVIDLIVHCDESGKTGNDLVLKFFLQLTDDMCNYPGLTLRLLTNSVLSEGGHSGMLGIQQLVMKNLEGKLTPKQKEDRYILLSGLFFGLMTHYAVNGLSFDKARLRRRVTRMMKPLLTAGPA